jgi:hypothetical protein
MLLKQQLGPISRQCDLRAQLYETENGTVLLRDRRRLAVIPYGVPIGQPLVIQT